MSTARTEKFELIGADGEPLYGDVRTAGDGSGRPTVVLCHGFKGGKGWGFFPQLAERLARAGMTAVSFNFSGSGVDADGNGFAAPERFARSTFSNDVKDIETVCDALSRGELVEGLVASSNYGLYGYSRGGGAAVLHAAENPAVMSLVTWAAISHVNRWDSETLAEWRESGVRVPPGENNGDNLVLGTEMLDDIQENAEFLDITSAASRIEVPWLILHGGADDFVPVSEGKHLHFAATRTNASFRVFDGGNHTFSAVGQLANALDQTLGWFSQHLF
jgi:dienelactone hydrolase